MNLIIDIGNTRAKLVAMDDDNIVSLATCSNTRLEGLHDFVANHHFERGIVSSVVQLSPEAIAALNGLSFPLLHLDADTPLPIHYRFPEGMGADRIAAIVGGMALRPGKPLLIVDAGTCVTYEIIDDHGHYLGGTIAPGLRLRFLAMHEHTSLLPLVETDGDTPDIGYDTPTAMRSGVVRGLQYEIEGYIRHFRLRFPAMEVFLTGGDNFSFPDDLSPIIHSDKNLVPRGLYAILQHNRIS